MGTTQKIATFIAETHFADLPAEASARAKDMFFDSIGVALAGTLQQSGKIAIQHAKELGGHAQASVLGDGFRTSAPMAAFTNAFCAHNLDYDDWVPAGAEKDNWPRNAGHVSGMLVPVALALSEKFDISGKVMIESFVLGVEVYGKIASSSSNVRQRGWHGMAIYGCMAAAATAAKMLQLDQKQIARTLGIAASAAGGVFANVQEYMTNPFHAGNAAHAGVTAALLASRGFTSNEDILEAPVGFCNAFLGEGNYSLEGMTRDLGHPFHIVCPGLGIKPYACAWPTFYATDGVLELVKKHNIPYDKVKEVEVWVSPYQYGSIEKMYRPNPQSGYEAKFSTNYSCANAILNVKLGLDTFTDARVKDPLVKDALSKIKMIVDETRRHEEGVFFAPVVIKLVDGTEYRHRVDVCKGHPKNPLSHDELLAKYRDCADRVLSVKDVARSIDLIENLEELDDAKQLMASLSRS